MHLFWPGACLSEKICIEIGLNQISGFPLEYRLFFGGGVVD